ncbi:MAG: dihydrolipoyl dehydrogenase [Rhodobacteraceae bacterium]|nr:dihydrolipoyl dehydrogenase [Paracoccaceae bacterium]
MATQNYDLIIIGSGPGGYVAAIRAAQLGMSVAVVEREDIGGICLNWGCIPTKSMLRSAEIYHLMERANEYGLSTQSISYDINKIIDRSKAVAKQLSNGVQHLLKKNKVTVFLGTAQFTGPNSLVINDNNSKQEISAAHVIIATGARARDLPGMEADGKLIWSYRHALRADRVPKKLLVIGSGAIGIEFASFFNALGSETTVVEMMDSILPVEDQEISAFAKKRFEKLGIKFIEGAKVAELTKTKAGGEAKIESSTETIVATFDTVISAVGIVGNVEGMNLDKIGVKVERTHIKTDEYCRTGVSNVYAIGDVAGPPWLAHKASHEGVMVAELVAESSPHPIQPTSIPGCTYSNPQIASVGLTEEACKEQGLDYSVGRFPFIGNGKAIALGEPEGLMKTIFDKKTGELLGAHMVGAEVTELIQGFVIGKELETTEQELMNTIFPHPTLSEMIHESVLSAYGKAIHF